MRRKPVHSFEFELERGDATVEYTCEFTVSPYEPPHGPTYDCGGYPGADASVEDKEVFFLRLEPCHEHRWKYAGRTTCAACKKVKEPRPEMLDLVDDDELLEYAGEREADAREAAAEARWEARNDR